MSDYFNNQDAPPPAPIGIAHRLEKWFPHISKDKIDQLDRYHDELMKFNRTINLISSNSVKSADIVHFADSVSACQIIEPALILDAPVYDFGSGNGFPGLIFGILFPKTKVILIERDSKKAEFLKHVRGILNLGSVEIHNMEPTDLPENSVVNAMARGYAPLHKIMLQARHQLKLGGKFFHLKNDSWTQELASVPSQLFSVWNPALLGQYSLPESGVLMSVVVTEKVKG